MTTHNHSIDTLLDAFTAQVHKDADRDPESAGLALVAIGFVGHLLKDLTRVAVAVESIDKRLETVEALQRQVGN